MILYFAADLIWATKIKGVADALGIPARPVRNCEMLAARLAEATAANPVRALILDLDKPDEALALLAHAREFEKTLPQSRIRIVAFGPHVAKDLFQRALDAGADQALTRGGFDHNMDEILLSLEGRG